MANLHGQKALQRRANKLAKWANDIADASAEHRNQLAIRGGRVDSATMLDQAAALLMRAAAATTEGR